MLFAIFLGLLFVAFVVCIIFSAKNWHWMHLTAVILVFLMAIPAVYRGYQVFETRTKFLADANKSKIDVEKAKKQYDDVLYGATQGPDGSFGEGSAKKISVELALMNLDRGRVWNDCVVSDNSEDGFTLTFNNPIIPPEEGDEPDDGQAVANPELEAGEVPGEKSLVFLFESVDATAQNSEGQEISIRLPGRFLGTAVVQSVNGGILEFKKKDKVQPIQNDAVVKVYEKPATDFHGIIAQALGMDRDKLPSIEEFRKQFIENFPAESMGLTQDSKTYQKILDEFSFDRRELAEINQYSNKVGRGDLTFPPENIYVEMKVEKEITRTVDGDTSVYDGGLFTRNGDLNNELIKTQDKSGKVVIPASKEGEDSIIIVPLQIGVLGYTKTDGVEVKSYQEQGLAIELKRFYFRPLHNYTSEVVHKMAHIEYFKERTAELNLTNDLNEKAKAAAEIQIQNTDKGIADHSSDLKDLQEDVRNAEAYEKQLTNEIAMLQKQIRDNYLRMSHIISETHRLNEKWSREKESVTSSFN